MGIARVLFAALLVATNLWLTQGSFVPVETGRTGVAYALVSPSFGRFLAWLTGALAVLLGLQLIAWRHSGAPLRTFFVRTRHLDPLWWSALSLVPLANLHPAIAGRIPALTYVLFDMRWFWWPVLLAAVVASLAPWSPLRGRAEGWTAAAVVAVPVLAAVFFTPHLRFSGVLHGDEPKYMRYAENFYQGVGFDVAAKRPLEELPPDQPPQVHRLAPLLVRALVEEARLLWTDARRLLGLPAPPRLLAGEPSPEMFFRGKHSGTLYQLHNPGIAFLLFPGYLVDRWWTGSGVGYQGEFPSEMPALHVSLLLLYGGYALALYALLRRVSDTRAHAWTLAALGAVALPAGAFAFQIYPEAAAGLIVLVLARELAAPSAHRNAGLAVLGLLAGFLPWLHIRLALVSMAVLAMMLASPARSWRARLWFAGGLLVALAALSLYTYRLTGSLLPIATYGSDAPLSIARAVQGVPAFLLDRDWGLLPHAPLYLLALPGLAIAWRERRRAVVVVVVLFAAVAIPGAAHGFWAGGSTPGRYLVAGAPLLLVLASRTLGRWGHARLLQGLTLAAALVTVETAVRYNLHHVKEYGPLVASGSSGWRLNLLFPSLGTGEWTRAPGDLALLAAWLAFAGLLFGLGVVAAARPEAAAATRPRRPLPLAAGSAVVSLIAVAAAGDALAAGTGRRSAEPYIVPPREAREITLATFAAQSQCALCVVTGYGAGDPLRALRNEAGSLFIRVDSRNLVAGDPIIVTVRPRSVDGEFLVGSIRVDFGDGHTDVFARQFGDRTIEHVYARPGEYRLRAWVRTADDRRAAAEMALQVRAPSVP